MNIDRRERGERRESLKAGPVLCDESARDWHGQQRASAPPYCLSVIVRRILALAAILCALSVLCGESCFAQSKDKNPDPRPGPTRLVKLSGFLQHLQWSPDGKKFLFTRVNYGGKMGLWT